MENKKIEYYVTESGKKPFLDWLKKLDNKLKATVTDYIYRIASSGSKRNIKSLKDGVFEIRIFHQSGIRVYFGEDGDKIILLLLGGNKGSQKSDILKAKKYWSDYGKKK